YSMLIKTMELLSYDFSIGLCERHHRGKKDSPSGTMKEMLSIIGEMEKKRSLLFEKDTSVMRIGEIVGEHKASFYGTGEYVEISHIVHNRKVFAIGALRAALFLQQNDVGMFNMRDVLI
ncbi:dihydrodipicolinate reductase C-terminal domain-containing protein, partial [Candidatus Ichthyocystis hellenicum]|uniref:dihydrodipicolinate reductase C-terminal domain-containing protein n=2 Tax=Candidatus Ichthyocystis TaxID=2929841 RepID=UPI002417B98F